MTAVRRPQRNRSKCRAGFTLVELTLAIAIVAVLMFNISTVVDSSRKNFVSSTAQMDVDLQLARAMDRMVLAVMGSSRSSIFLEPTAPNSEPALNYERHLGVENGEPILGPPERIEFRIDDGEAVWIQDAGGASERQVVWAKWVTELLENETWAPGDENNNGLFEETGLAFVLDQNSVRIYLTLQRVDALGNTITRTLERRVACRN
jgi:prepilin-type N-terminal cleavage/methylation domain-containing protein